MHTYCVTGPAGVKAMAASLQGPPSLGALPHATALLHIISVLQQQVTRQQRAPRGGSDQLLQVAYQLGKT